ncbi:PilZ domain-containing protein [Parendozoicomonas sp. Alg238-R29]|uniref:PilZ domain-containing protein n=1 Tax=Parendozoicomonas sp. Alg238-R29 TaxID=2993446 RepID=UPI00248E06E0|nr:PilZ domain-containing protein [Parendozoicomonas sp. Alg238-R29]
MSTGKKGDSHSEKRREIRKQLSRPFDTFNSLTDEPIGQLVNLSQSGFMLSSQTSIPEGIILQCRVDIVKENGQGHSVNIGAESLWKKSGHSNQQHWSGFRILDISNQDLLLIQELLEAH